ncbi:hypothetical protein ABEG74_00300 [Pantoea agglomerans]|uniref:hypothetical protein n=1 Tax=Enterobacter agglomerans TaxID=549 RepID=UPI000B7A7BF2|nr:hypothetical protein [Pantoea agglomerans]OXH78728.1 hypothetical protein CBI57_11195 [Pantoea agglomerans]
MHQIFSFIISLLSLVFIILLIWSFFRPLPLKKWPPPSPGEMKKISANTPILKKLGMNTEDYYYDSDFLYQQRDGETLCKVPLENIIRIKVTGTEVSSRRVWLVRYVTGAYKTEREFRVLNNYTLFNRDFAGFLAAVKAANPEAEVQEMTLGRL